MIAVPRERDVTSPEALMVATSGALLVHTAAAVSSLWDPSEKIPVAVACADWPSARVEAPGATFRLESCRTLPRMVRGPPHPDSKKARRKNEATKDVPLNRSIILHGLCMIV